VSVPGSPASRDDKATKKLLSEELIEERREEALRELTDDEVLAAWRCGELVVRTGRIHHGNLCVCPEKGDGEWCDKCEGYAMEQGQ